jgi:DMSO/TMAO reductase YedYZ molybdopterin-dependent catalytic subunit
MDPHGAATLDRPAAANRLREGVKYPKFADKFARLDFTVEPMPVIALYPIPEALDLGDLELSVAGLDCHVRTLRWRDCADLPRYRMRAPLICQIFNWAEVVEWEGVRLSDLLQLAGVETHQEGYVAVSSRDGVYFEGLSMDEALDPRVLLATGLNGTPLPREYGGPLRLVVPFLQGYKSVKWVGGIRAFRHDPVGIKRLLAQSKIARLAPPWRERFGIVPPGGRSGDPDPGIGDGEPISAGEIPPVRATGLL